MSKYEDIRWKWLEERGFNVMCDPQQLEYVRALWKSPDEIQGVFCESPAGTGKTVLAVLAGAYAVEVGEYKQLIYIRNPISVGNEIGFLPGEIEGKILPYMMPFIDALEYVKPGTFKEWSAVGKAVAITPTFERGVTYDNAFVIIDEAQSFTLNELQTIYTRPTDRCKIVTIGSLLQIDNPNLTLYSGLTPFEVYMRHFRGFKSSYHRLETNYRGEWSSHADRVRETIESIDRDDV